MQVFMGFRPRHRKLRAKDIKGGIRLISTYTKIFLYPTLEFAQCRMLWDDDLLRHGARHKNGLRADSTEAGVPRRCDSSKGEVMRPRSDSNGSINTVSMIA